VPLNKDADTTLLLLIICPAQF